MSEIYCGIEKIPKNKKRGSMKDCAEIGQIRYYGLKKVDSRLIENALNEKKLKASGTTKLDKKIEELNFDAAGLSGKLKKIQNQIKGEKNKDTKEKLEKEVEKIKDKLKKIKQEVDAAEKQKKQKNGSKKTKKISRIKMEKSKKKSKKSSKKKSK
jgi:hypothetical protein